MQTLHFVLIGGDMRQLKLAQLLRANGHHVSTYALSAPLPPGVTPLASLSHASSSAAVILPLPLSLDQLCLNAPLFETPISLERLFSELSPSQKILGGFIDPSTFALAKSHNLTLADYYTQEELIIAGAAATAEGAIMLTMTETDTMLSGSSALVLGFGRIGKLLAHKLHALNAKVSVCARKYSDLAWIKAYGYTPIPLTELDNHLHQFSLIYNTAPTPLFDLRRLALFHPDSLYIELASAPYGIDFTAAKNLGLRTILAPGLPGKVSPTSSAHALKETLYHILAQEESN